ncbi:hypothetical protein CDAR_6791 [Caerostris darwini]|uniref:Uncharacterized protein n=1 Tax=Caerostris darwini TaxID=1538125 RepID=A0AAV4TB99_9ARAC|nr:hypothetical protein CDAR_6791 [Caerostris darwini]
MTPEPKGLSQQSTKNKMAQSHFPEQVLHETCATKQPTITRSQAKYSPTPNPLAICNPNQSCRSGMQFPVWHLFRKKSRELLCCCLRSRPRIGTFHLEKKDFRRTWKSVTVSGNFLDGTGFTGLGRTLGPRVRFFRRCIVRFPEEQDIGRDSVVHRSMLAIWKEYLGVLFPLYAECCQIIMTLLVNELNHHSCEDSNCGDICKFPLMKPCIDFAVPLTERTNEFNLETASVTSCLYTQRKKKASKGKFVDNGHTTNNNNLVLGNESFPLHTH